MLKDAVARHYAIHGVLPRFLMVSQEIWNRCQLPANVLGERLRVDTRLPGFSCYTKLGE